jgi:hypothetical protein
MDILEAHRLGVGPGQGDLRRVLGKQRRRVDGGEVEQLGGMGHVDGRVQHQGVGRWGDAAVGVGHRDRGGRLDRLDPVGGLVVAGLSGPAG